MRPRYRWPAFKNLVQLLMGCWEGWETTVNHTNPKSLSHVSLILCICVCVWGAISFINEKWAFWTDRLFGDPGNRHFHTLCILCTLAFLLLCWGAGSWDKKRWRATTWLDSWTEKGTCCCLLNDDGILACLLPVTKPPALIRFQELMFSLGTPPVSSILKYLLSTQVLWGCCLWGGGAEPSLLSEQLLTWLTLPVYSYVWPESRLYKRHRTGLKAHVPLQITIPFTHLPSLICSPPLSL